MIMRFITILGCLLLSSSFIIGQGDKDIWKDVGDKNLTINKSYKPKHFRTTELNVKQLEQRLENTPRRFSEKAAIEELLPEISIPMAEGKNLTFKVVESELLPVKLAKQFPAIKAYIGYSKEDPTARLRLEKSHKGVFAMVFSEKEGTTLVEPVDITQSNQYISYKKSDCTTSDEFECTVIKDKKLEYKPTDFKSFTQDCQLRTYRLAVACTGEYGQYHGGTKPDALAAIVTIMNRVNGVYERDLGIRMNLVDNNLDILYTIAASDPFTNSDITAMINQNQNVCNQLIGTFNYDIGHVFGTSGGGLAFLGSVCSNSNKAKGGTALSNPIGDPFAIDYVSHEMGHQFGADHTQNNDCQRNNATAMEPGSGSTIMGYAGICSPNVQFNSDDYFHAISIEQIYAGISGGFVGFCAEETPIDNNPPEIIPHTTYTVPISTPFVLTCIAGDADGDALTYCWEQMDNQIATMPPADNSVFGPMFRSLEPTASPQRYFPALNTLLNNGISTWEVLPSVSRSMEFTCVVRDNRLGGGCATSEDVVIEFSNKAGPFLVESPNGGESWLGESNRMIQWDPARTDNNTINAQEVDIVMSTDGGQTYDVVLAENVPNTGEYMVTVPNIPGSTNRIMIVASDNIFFDISDDDFEILPCSNCTTESGVSLKLWLEGFYDGSVNEMPTDLLDQDLIPLEQPFNVAPYNYTGTESVAFIPPNTVDWVLLEVRDATDVDAVVQQKATFLRNDGKLMDLDGSLGVEFPGLVQGGYYVVVRHKSHIDVVSAAPVSVNAGLPLYDFTSSTAQAMGVNQQKFMNGTNTMYCGDYDGNGVNNNLDYNLWRQDNAALFLYLHYDGDGNGIINNLDYNLWERNRSKIGADPIQY